MTGSKKKLRADKLIPIMVASDKPAAPVEPGTDSQPASSAFANQPSHKATASREATADKPPSAETTKQS